MNFLTNHKQIVLVGIKLKVTINIPAINGTIASMHPKKAKTFPVEKK